MQLQFIPFKIGSLWSNTAIPVLLPLSISVEEVFTWDVVHSPRCSCLDIFNCPKMMSSEVGFELGEWKEIAQSQVRAVRWVGKGCDIMLSQKFPHSEWCVTWRIVKVKEPRVCNFMADAHNSVSQMVEYL